MKLRKLLTQVRRFVNAKARARAEQMDSMREVLAALKDKERRLKSKAKSEKNAAARSELEKKRKVVHAQRKKGLIALKALKKS